MSVLSRTYIDLNISVAKSDIKELEEYLPKITQEYASLLFRQSVQVRIEYWQGSFKAVLTVAGSIYIAIGAYGTIRSGIDYLIKDGRAVRDYIHETLIKDGLPGDRISEITYRQATPERIRRLFRRIEKHKDKSRFSNDQRNHDHERELIQYMVARVISEDLDNELDIKAFIDSIDSQYNDKDLVDLCMNSSYAALSSDDSEIKAILPGSSGGLEHHSFIGARSLEPCEDFTIPKAPESIKLPP
jgi:hypothetical protein